MMTQRTSLVVSGSVLVVIIAAVFVFLVPIINDLQDSARRLDTARSQQADLQEASRATSLQKRTFTELKEQNVDFSAFRVSEETIVGFLDTLDRTAATHRVALVVENLPPPSTAKISQVPLSMRGTLPDLLAFIRALEALPTYLSITDLGFSPVATDTQHPVMTLTAKATLTWL